MARPCLSLQALHPLGLVRGRVWLPILPQRREQRTTGARAWGAWELPITCDLGSVTGKGWSQGVPWPPGLFAHLYSEGVAKAPCVGAQTACLTQEQSSDCRKGVFWAMVGRGWLRKNRTRAPVRGDRRRQLHCATSHDAAVAALGHAVPTEGALSSSGRKAGAPGT